MEAPEYFAESWNSQSTPEKQGKDHFVVEDLLDFSNQEDDDNGVGEEEEACVEDATGNSTECSTVTAFDSSISSLSGGDQNLSGELLADAGDLCEQLQHEELAELEWLSNFVEESFTSEEDLQKLQLISGVQSSSSSEATRVHVQSSSSDKITDEAPADDHFLPEAPSVPAKARSKRSRAAACNWSSRLLVLPANADSAAAPTSSSDSDSVVIDVVPKKTPKKREPGGPAGPALAPSADGRRCLHCATDKTPQWRTGPMGPKTLCNACGVRYKSGRLVPEYRPASSPTFVLSRHSNSHRKVLELRRQKEMDQHQQQHALLHTGNSVYDRGAVVAGDEFLIHKRLCPDFRQLIQQ